MQRYRGGVLLTAGLLVAGLAAWWMLGGGDAPAVRQPDATTEGVATPQDAAQPPALATEPGLPPIEDRTAAVVMRDDAATVPLATVSRRCFGTLRDPDGKPVAAANVLVFRPIPFARGGRIVAEASSDAEGHFSVDIPHGEGFKITVSTDGFEEAREDLSQRGLSERDFVLQPVK